MATLLWRRDVGNSISGVTDSFSSWDACMSKTYCKWPVIIGIIIGSLIVLSLLTCLFRCLCCGVECCCGCLSCCNACCPSPRRSGKGYEQAPPQPQPFNNQYQSPAQPMYGENMGYRGAGANVPQTATFDAPTKNGRFNEDALPPMPSWDRAASHRVEHEDVEMDKFDPTNAHSPNPAAMGGGHAAQQESLLPKQETGRYYIGGSDSDQRTPHAQNGDMGMMSATPYHDYAQHQQVSPNPYGSQRQHEVNNNVWGPTQYAAAASPAPYAYGANNDYFVGAGQPQTQYGGQHYGGQPRGYEPSVPPSYRSRPPSGGISPISPQAAPQSQAYGAGNIGRKPVQGSWREV